MQAPADFPATMTTLLERMAGPPKPQSLSHVHTLDLSSPHFVSFAQVSSPPRDGVVLLADVMRDVSGQNAQFFVRDVAGREVLLKFTGGDQADEVLAGGMVCVRAPRLHQFLDGQVGLRVEEQDFAQNFKFFPGCSLASFKRLNERLVQTTAAPRCEKCQSTEARSLCSRCRCARYCSRECQQQHWRLHKYACEIVKTLREYDELFSDSQARRLP